MMWIGFGLSLTGGVLGTAPESDLGVFGSAFGVEFG